MRRKRLERRHVSCLLYLLHNSPSFAWLYDRATLDELVRRKLAKPGDAGYAITETGITAAMKARG